LVLASLNSRSNRLQTRTGGRSADYNPAMSVSAGPFADRET
jgi:hypothetical protein